MKERHRISDNLFDTIYKAITGDCNWIAFRSNVFFLQKDDLHFFRTPLEARAFADGEHTAYAVTFASSVPSLYRELEGWKTTIKIYSSKKINIMNEKYLADLKNNLKYMGFGDKLNEQLEVQMDKGGPNFQLKLDTEINNKAFAAVLNFKKSDTTERYFFNSYHATLGRKDGETVDQAFYLKDGKGITAKEAFNLLDGRAVHKELTNKEGVEYKAWVQIDFEKRDKNNNHEMKQFHENYGYDLKTAVGKFAVAELDGGDKEKALMASLQKGNVQSVTIDVKGEPQKMFMEANPQYKSVTLYDEGLKRVPKEELEKYKGTTNTQGIGEGQISKQDSPHKDVNQSKVGEMSSGQPEGKEQKVEKKISDGEGKKSLLPKTKPLNGLMDKKRVSKSKGQHLT